MSDFISLAHASCVKSTEGIAFYTCGGPTPLRNYTALDKRMSYEAVRDECFEHGLALARWDSVAEWTYLQQIAGNAKCVVLRKQEEIALWTGVEGNGSIPIGDGTNGYYFYHEYGVHHGNGVHHGYDVRLWYGRMGCTLARWSTIARVSTMARGTPSLGCLDCRMILVSVPYICPDLNQRLQNKKEKKKKGHLQTGVINAGKMRTICPL